MLTPAYLTLPLPPLGGGEEVLVAAGEDDGGRVEDFIVVVGVEVWVAVAKVVLAVPLAVSSHALRPKRGRQQ